MCRDMSIYYASRILFSKYLYSSPRILSCYSTQVSQSPLAQLRKRTGYSFAKCKEALTKFNNNVDLAEQYVRDQAQREGWAKAQRVKDRATGQGVIGVMVQDTNGVMMEINCETDFVSKNPEFRNFAAELVQSAFTSSNTHQHKSLHHMTSHDLTRLSLTNLTNNDNETVSDIIAKQIGRFGENITISRACIVSSPPGEILRHYVYNDVQVPGTNVILGTYAALALIKVGGVKDGDVIRDIGLKLCQHIVGMNPRPLGDKERPGEQREELVHQDYLLEPSVKMGEWLGSHDVHVTDFIRYELGEHDQ